MIAFLTIIYVALVLLVFRVLKVPPRPWPIALTVTLGVVLLATVVVLWTLAAPISTMAVVGRYSVELVPWVKGRVTSIPAQPNVPLKQGDVLYTVDPAPYQYTVSQIEAQLAAAKGTVTQLQAGVRVAEAAVKRAEATVAASKAAFSVAAAIEKENAQAISRLKMVQAKEQYAADEASLQQAQGSQEQALAAVAVARDNRLGIESQLESARFDLEQCTVRAPADGYVTNWAIREGTFVVPMPFAAAGTFIDTSETWVFAPYSAQLLVNVQPEQQVEMAFKSRPGQLFRGTVNNVLQATGEGQVVTTGKLPSAASIGSAGYLAVKMKIEGDDAANALEMGSAGAVAIYTDWGKPFHMISKVTIRMKKWLYFLPLPG